MFNLSRLSSKLSECINSAWSIVGTIDIPEIRLFFLIALAYQAGFYKDILAVIPLAAYFATHEFCLPEIKQNQYGKEEIQSDVH